MRKAKKKKAFTLRAECARHNRLRAYAGCSKTIKRLKILKQFAYNAAYHQFFTAPCVSTHNFLQSIHLSIFGGTWGIRTMTEAQTRDATREFKDFWKDKGYEKGESQPFWLALLRDVLGVEIRNNSSLLKTRSCSTIRRSLTDAFRPRMF